MKSTTDAIKLKKIIDRLIKLRYQKKYLEALTLCERTISEFEKGKYFKDTNILNVLIQKVFLHERMSRYDAAEEVLLFFEKVIKKNKNIYDNNLLIDYYFAKGQLAERRNKLKTAEKLYKKILLFIKQNEISNYNIIETNIRLIYLYINRNEPKNALIYIENAEQYLNSVFSLKNKFYYNFYYVILLLKAKIKASTFQTNDAIQLYQKSLRIIERNNLISFDYGYICLELSKLLLEKGDSSRIEKYLKIAKKIYKGTNLNVYEISYLEALKLYNEGLYEKSLDILENISLKTFPRLSKQYCEKIDLEIISKIAVIYNKLGNTSKSLEYLNILKNEIFITINYSAKQLNIYDRHYFLYSINNVLINVFELYQNYSKYSIEYKKELFEFRLLIKLIQSYQKLEKPPSFELISDLLYDDSVIVDILLVDNIIESKYYAFIIENNNISLSELGNKEKIENEYYNFYRNSLERKAIDLRSFNNYFAQIESYIENKIHTYLTLEGMYNFINIENLLTSNNNYYFETKYFYTFDNYFPMIINSNPTNKSASIFGHPSFETKLIKKYSSPPEYIEAKLKNEFKELPYSKYEGQIISEILRKNKYVVNEYYGTDASSKNLEKINNPKILHIATHGFNFKSLSQTKGIADWESLSGLLLSNSISLNGNEYYLNNEGMFYSNKIKKLKLKNTKLGVISSCYSGDGLIINTGILIGIQNAMFIAGVETLIVSLWKIEDKVTQEFMTEFYSEWVKEENVDSSFDIAKFHIKNKYLHPFYWAGFKLIHKKLIKG